MSTSAPDEEKFAASVSSGYVLNLLPLSSPSKFTMFLFKFPKLDHGTHSVSCTVGSAKLTETLVFSSSLCELKLRPKRNEVFCFSPHT